ncbi:MAG: hypothetical protein M1423_05865 [Acidobacteria bacterium]|nr:hypothetical protein [Acidobacteriota bacterium]
MKTYTVLYAEDVPHYGTAEIEAENDAEAIARASTITDEDIGNTRLIPTIAAASANASSTSRTSTETTLSTTFP